MECLNVKEISTTELDPFYILQDLANNTPNWDTLPFGVRDTLLSEEMEKNGYIFSNGAWVKN